MIGLTSQALHQLMNSVTSTRRSAVSQLWTHDCGLPSRRPSSRCVSPAASRISRMNPGTAWYGRACWALRGIRILWPGSALTRVPYQVILVVDIGQWPAALAGQCSAKGQTMRYPTATVLGVILLVASASRAAAQGSKGVLEVIEIAEHDKDPWPVLKLQTVEDQIAEYGQLIDNLKRKRFANRDEARERSEQIKEHRTKIVALKRRQRALRREVAAGMTEIRGWLGIEGSEIVIECRRKWRKEASRLQSGVIVDFVAERATQRYRGKNREWISPLDLEQVRSTPVGWRDPPASHAFSWSRVDLTATAKLQCQIKAEKTSSGRSFTFVDIQQIKPPPPSGFRSNGRGRRQVMEVRLRIYTLDAAGKPALLLTPQNGIVIARTRLGKSDPFSPLRTRFTPSVESEHGYHFEIVEVLAEVP